MSFHCNCTWMDSSPRGASSVFQDIGCKLYVCSVSCEKSCVEHKQCTSNMKAAVKIKPQEAIDISSISEKENLIVPDVGIAAGGILHVQDSHGQSSGSNATSDRDEEMNMCQEFFQSVSLDAKMQKCLSKCATFPSSKVAQPNSLSIKGIEGSPGTTAKDQCSPAFESSTYARSMSLPASLKLVSAMKGGRARNGAPTPSVVELRVKWAPEVYDPAATSMSHTVKSHHRRPPKAKKDKHKHNKGKSSRGSGGSERKPTNRRNISNIPPDPLDSSKLQASGEQRVVFGGCVRSNVAASKQEAAKCGSSFLREALANVHLSIGEAAS